MRIYSAAVRCIINPDGTLYLYQASAVFNHRWSALLNCELYYVSPLPFLIAFVFNFTGDWITAGQSLNVLFGWAALIPLYCLLRRFTDRTVAALTLLIFALIPIFVAVSGDVLRGPLFWFCLSMGMLLFVRQWDEKARSGRFRFDLLLSSLFFMVATWTRVEGVVFLAVSPLYLLISRNDRKLQRIIVFMSPLILIGLPVVVEMLYSGELSTVLRLKDIFLETTSFVSRYRALAAQIRASYASQPYIYAEFLRRAKETMGLIPLIVIFDNFIEGVFYPYALVYLVGLVGLPKRYRKDRRIGYFVALSFSSIVVLYIHIIRSWIFMDRFLAILIFPGCIFMAHGIETTIAYLRKRRLWQARYVVTAIAVLLILFGLPPNLKPKERDKIVYRQAADILSQHLDPDLGHSISAVQASRGLEWLLLYANRDRAVLPCAKGAVNPVPADYERFVSELDGGHLEYFFYEQRYWPKNSFDLLSAPYQKDFYLLGSWRHPDSSRFILFQRKSNRNILPEENSASVSHKKSG